MAKKENKDVVEKNYPDFVESVQGLTVQQLEARLVTYAKEQEKINKAKQEDLESSEDGSLGRLKAAAQIAEAPYKDATKAIKEKTTYIVNLIGEKGGNIDVESDSDEE